MKNIRDIYRYNFFNDLCKIASIKEIWLFGSRARGDNLLRSDIDLYIVAPDTTLDDIKNAEHLMREGDSLLKIDIVWSQTLTNNVLSEQIERDKMLLYKKDKINIEIIEIKLEDLEKSLRRFERTKNHNSA